MADSEQGANKQALIWHSVDHILVIAAYGKATKGAIMVRIVLLHMEARLLRTSRRCTISSRADGIFTWKQRFLVVTSF